MSCVRANSAAIGSNAKATFDNSAAIGTGATTSRANQQSFGTAANTYTLAGITSGASKAAQSGADPNRDLRCEWQSGDDAIGKPGDDDRP
jgi:hypothetical protein